MGRRRNRLQMKGKNSPGEELDELETINLSDREFRVMITRILKSMKKDIETTRKGQSERKNAVCEITHWRK